MYGVRYLGYSYTNCAWYAFPFEGLEVFTIALLQVISADFLLRHAPPGALATLTGIAGGMHQGFGKGVGGLAGGIIREMTKSTKIAFYYFAMFSFACGGVYGVLANIYAHCAPKMPAVKAKSSKEDPGKAEPFLLGRTADSPDGIEVALEADNGKMD